MVLNWKTFQQQFIVSMLSCHIMITYPPCKCDFLANFTNKEKMNYHCWPPISHLRKQPSQLLILAHWVSIPGVPRSKPLGGSKIDSVFHPSKVDKMSTTNSLGLVVKNKLSSQSGSVALRRWNSIHKNGP